MGLVNASCDLDSQTSETLLGRERFLSDNQRGNKKIFSLVKKQKQGSFKGKRGSERSISINSVDSVVSTETSKL